MHYKNNNTQEFGDYSTKPGEEWSELSTTEVTNLLTKPKLKQRLIRSRLDYLENTDHYALKEIDEPGSYPLEIKEKRIKARQQVEVIQNSTTLTQFNKFSEVFE